MSINRSLYLLALLPAIAHAEVMDKEFPFSTVLIWTLVGAVAVFCSARFKPLMLAAAIPILGTFFTAHVSELLDPYVGPAIYAEAGTFYVLVSWAGPVIVCGALICGLTLRSHRAKADI